MKTFKEFTTESTSFQDPPTILSLRRTAVRMFPNKQSVATYSNKQLGIEIAIPYTPGQLGKHKIHVSGVSEEIEDWINESLIVMEEQNINEVMSPELKKIRKERTIFKRDLMKAQDDLDTSRTRLDWAKRALKGHIKKHGKVLDPIKEETISELSKKTLARYVNKAADDMHTAGHAQAHAAASEKNPKFKMQRMTHAMTWAERRKKGIKTATKKLSEEALMESSMYSLHAMAKTKSSAQVRFRDGSTVMVDHPEAAQVLHLHGKVNRLNKRKIESLVNGSPSGLKKVLKFYSDHVKQGKK